jgi:PAS domain S-box-containing protein
MRTGIGSRFTLATSLLVLVATATVGYTVYRGARNALIEGAADGLAHSAEVIDVRFAATIEATGKDVRFLSNTPPAHGIVRALSRYGLDPQTAILDYEWRDQLAEIFQSFLISRPSHLRARFIRASDGLELVRVEKQGGNVVRMDGDSLTRVGDQTWVREAASLPRGSLYFSNLMLSGPTGGSGAAVPVMYAATPIYRDGGGVFGVLAIDVNFTDVMNTLRGLVDSTQALYIATADGDLLLQPDRPSELTTGTAPPNQIQDVFPSIQPFLDSQQRELRIQNAHLASGETGVGFFRRLAFDRGVGREDLILGVTEPHTTVLADVRQIRNQSALITILFCLCGIAVALTLSRYMVRPLHKITRAVSLFGLGKHDVALPVDRRDEIGVLARTYDAMARQIEDQIGELEDKELRQRTVLETSAEGIMVTGADGTIETFNRAAERILGYASAEVTGHKASDLIRPYGDIERRENLSPAEEPWMHMRQGGEAAGRRQDGSIVPLAVSWSTFEIDGEKRYTIFLRDITEQKAAAAAQARLLRELEQERASLQQLSETLEERVKLRTADLVRINDALQRRNRELREFAHVASHDLQEPLRRIRSFADLLLSEHEDELDEQARHYVTRMCDAADRMSQLIADLRSFSSITTRTRPFEQVDLNRVAEEVISDLEIYIRETDGRIEVSALPTIDADSVQMRQLLQNLLINGLKFHKPGVPPIVEVSAVIEHTENLTSPGMEMCVLMVKDNGIGFDEKYLDRIFSPFQRLHTRDSYEGTGMGLAICRRIAEHHGGMLTARSTPGEGAVFIVSLPIRHTNLASEEILAEEENA